ncbi:unnamed protein product [Adineta steineri]|uniref:Uncharacterized protein n=1 Tax=Adineta steineri TaxID=433720 RepID=A0A819CLJ9_9BILA|nr:unnamed protein product [Adineta steineri]CAF1145209.1 unnamed protein product [Adineta steineri]CAF3820985.1 unnamed protein product [Adineta steineri]CAF3925787.1 unnamed protein product [Adineta steineri]
MSQTSIDDKIPAPVSNGIIYDYTVFGSDSADAVLANRLSKQKDKQVLLIEADGTVTTDTIHMPTEGQYARGDPHDYDSWELEEWSFNKLLPYFKNLERADINSIPENEKFCNHDQKKGMMDVTVLEESNKLNRLFIKSCEKNGFHQTKDYNADESLNGCVSISQISTKHGKRCSTASGYLLSAIKRNNFHILTNAHTCRVLFNEEKQTTGVIVRRDSSPDKEEFIKGKEVILSAGAIGSPRSTCKISTLENLQRWSTEGKDSLVSNMIESHAKTQVSDTQLHFGRVAVDAELMKNFNFNPKIYEQYLNSYLSDGEQLTVICFPTLLHPKSTGEITLASRDPFIHPIINPNYLQNQEDVQTLVEACKLVDKICHNEPLNNTIRSLAKEMNGTETIDDEDKFWESYVRKYTVTAYHPVGTCKMGKQQDEMTVVTSDTKVKGVTGLRVIDASIMPSIISSNTNIPTIAIAERAADLIKNI